MTPVQAMIDDKLFEDFKIKLVKDKKKISDFIREKIEEYVNEAPAK